MHAAARRCILRAFSQSNAYSHIFVTLQSPDPPRLVSRHSKLQAKLRARRHIDTPRQQEAPQDSTGIFRKRRKDRHHEHSLMLTPQLDCLAVLFLVVVFLHYTSSPHHLITSSPHHLITSSPHHLIVSGPYWHIRARHGTS
jgi:hypothetical protein